MAGSPGSAWAWVAPRLTGNAYPQPPSASIFTLRPTTPKPDKSDSQIYYTGRRAADVPSDGGAAFLSPTSRGAGGRAARAAPPAPPPPGAAPPAAAAPPA